MTVDDGSKADFDRGSDVFSDVDKVRSTIDSSSLRFGEVNDSLLSTVVLDFGINDRVVFLYISSHARHISSLLSL